MRLVVGRIGRAHGVRGEATVEVRTDDPETRFAVGTVLDTDPPERGPLTIVDGRVHNGILLLSFDGITDRSAVEALRDTLLYAEVDIEESEDEDDFHDQVLLEMEVRTLAGATVGRVGEVIHLPAQDLLSVRTPDDREVLVPFVREIVPTIDRASRTIYIDPPPGLIDPPDGEVQS